jgi:Flp pilus assembly protein TadD
MAAITVQQTPHPAAVQFQSGQLGAAESLCRSVLATLPNHAGALHQLGTICIAAGRYGEASQWLGHAVAQSPREESSFCDLGVSRCFQGQVEEAVQAFQRAATLQPDLLEAHLNLIEALRTAGDWEEVIEHVAEELPEPIAKSR